MFQPLPAPYTQTQIKILPLLRAMHADVSGSLFKCVCESEREGGNRGYPIQDKISPARPYTADGAVVAKKSLQSEPTVEHKEARKATEISAEMATKRKKINKSPPGSRCTKSSCQVVEGKIICSLLSSGKV